MNFKQLLLRTILLISILFSSLTLQAHQSTRRSNKLYMLAAGVVLGASIPTVHYYTVNRPAGESVSPGVALIGALIGGIGAGALYMYLDQYSIDTTIDQVEKIIVRLKEEPLIKEPAVLQGEIRAQAVKHFPAQDSLEKMSQYLEQLVTSLNCARTTLESLRQAVKDQENPALQKYAATLNAALTALYTSANHKLHMTRFMQVQDTCKSIGRYKIIHDDIFTPGEWTVLAIQQFGLHEPLPLVRMNEFLTGLFVRLSDMDKILLDASAHVKEPIDELRALVHEQKIKINVGLVMLAIMDIEKKMQVLEQNNFIGKKFMTYEDVLHDSAIRFGGSWPLVLAQKACSGNLVEIQDIIIQLNALNQTIKTISCGKKIETYCQELMAKQAILFGNLTKNLNMIVMHQKYDLQLQLLDKHNQMEKNLEHQKRLEKMLLDHQKNMEKQRHEEAARQRAHEEKIEQLRFAEAQRQREHEAAQRERARQRQQRDQQPDAR